MLYVPYVSHLSASFFFSFCQALHFVFAFGIMSGVHTVTLFSLPSPKYGRIFTVIYLAVHWESDSSILSLAFSFVNLVLPEYREGFGI